MNRIESYVDLSKLAAIREFNGYIVPTHADVCVVAEELDESGKVVRSWFLVVGESQFDGKSLPATVPAHSVVDPDIRPGEASKPPTPREAPGIAQQTLHSLRKERLELHAQRERHLIYCREWHQHLATIAEHEKRIEQLESELKAADARNREFAERAATLDSELQATRAELATLRDAKSLKRKATELVKRWQWS